MILYPAIDLKDGQCVRLLKGEMAEATVFSDDPAAQARAFEVGSLCRVAHGGQDVETATSQFQRDGATDAATGAGDEGGAGSVHR